MRPLLIVVLVAALSGPDWQRPGGDRGHRLENLSWIDAEPLLTPQAVVVIPLAPASSEHGPHLPLRADLVLAEYFAGRVMEAAPVVVAPAVTYHYAPGLFEYAGSATLALSTARDVVVDLVRSFARYGPRRFYVLSTSVSAERALEPAAATLAGEGVLLRFARYGALLDRASRGIRQQNVVGHADEVETSMLLSASDVVDMSKAVRDFSPGQAFGRLTRRRDVQALYSPSGTWGDPTLATKEKGRAIADSLVASLLQEIDDLRQADIPSSSQPSTAAGAGARTTPATQPAGAGTEQAGCTPADERTILAIGGAFGAAWAAADAQRLGGLWSADGNIVHPDGLVERGAVPIAEARAELFSRRAYRGSRHPMTLSMVRCLAQNVAVADGRWELRGLTTAAGVPIPTLEGLCTLVVRRNIVGWQIEAYRYSMKTPAAPVPPNVLKRPGYPGGL
jgi:creatinine amidohydrolase